MKMVRSEETALSPILTLDCPFLYGENSPM